MSKPKEEILLGRLKSNDEQAFQEVYHHYHPQLFSFAFRYLKCDVRSEDVVQDAFMKLWDHRQRLESNIKGFLFTTAKNRAINKIRNNKRKRNHHNQLMYVSDSSVSGTADVLIYSDYTRILQEALDSLPEGKRTIFDLKTTDGLSNQAVADKLGITINTVKSQYYQASRYVKKYLDEHAGIAFNA